MKRSLLIIALVAIVCLALGFLLDSSSYTIRVICLILLAASLGQCWNIVGGLANQISLGHAAFFGIGAYTTTILQIRFGISPWLGLPVAVVLASLAALLISIPTMRLKGPYFALATLAFGEACSIIATSMPKITGGPQGISVPFVGDSLAMMQFRHPGSYIPLFVGVFVLISLVYVYLSTGKMGYFLRAIREDENAAEMSGVNTLKIKLIGSVVSASLTAVVGVMFAQFVFFFDPSSVFSVTGISIRAALIAIVGGVGIMSGPILGAIFVVVIEEILNAYLSDKAAGIAPFIFGVVLIGVVLLKPRGLVSFFDFNKKNGGH